MTKPKIDDPITLYGGRHVVVTEDHVEDSDYVTFRERELTELFFGGRTQKVQQQYVERIDDEGVHWIRGHHTIDSVAFRAMKLAYALTSGPDPICPECGSTNGCTACYGL